MPPDFSLSLWQPIQNSLISAFWDSIGRFVAVAAVCDGCPPWATLRSLVIKRHRTVLIRTAAMPCVMECKSLILKVQAQEQNGTRAKARDNIQGRRRLLLTVAAVYDRRRFRII